MRSRRTVALVLPISMGYCRGILRGVQAYNRLAQAWELLIVDPAYYSALGRVDALVGLFGSQEQVAVALRRRVPCINVSSRQPFGLPTVVPDNYAIGRIAGEFFLDRGFRHFAYVGFGAGVCFSEDRARGFFDAVGGAGSKGIEFHREPQRAARDLARLPRPLAVLACNDHTAKSLVDAALRRGLRVGEDIAIAGVDNDELICEIAPVPLSSVDPGSENVGYEAARLLERLLRGEPAPAAAIRVPPGGFVCRASSDLLAIEDPEVAHAVRYIEAHACAKMVVEDILRNRTISRRTLEKRFRRLRGLTLYQEICRVRYRRARQLLAETDLPVPVVGRHVGFADPKRFSVQFRQAVGVPPSTFRQNSRRR